MSDETRASLELLYNVSRELTSALDLHTVLARVMFLSTANVQAERGSVIVIDEHQRPVDAAVVFEGKFVSHTIEQLKATLEQGLAGWVVRNRQPTLVRDTSQDIRWLHRAYNDIENGRAKSAICVPILVRDALVGVLTLVHATPNFFGVQHLSLLQAIAEQAGIAIHNAQLYESLQATNRRYHELFEDSIDPILVTNLEGRILETNRQAAAVSGRQADELIGTLVWDLQQTGPEWLLKNLTAIRSGVTLSYESSLSPLDHPAVPVEIHVHAINFGGDELLQWILRDISERRQLDSLRDDLAAMIYHDLRSPLANIVSSLDMLRLITEDNEMAQQVLPIAVRSTERMQRLINSLLDINRLEAGQPITNRVAVEIEPLFAEAVDAVQPITSTKRQKVILEISPDLPRMWADEDMIRRVMINLLENATKFTPIEGKPGRQSGKRMGQVMGERYRPRYPGGGAGSHL
jgi:PAS domain S-box-containing protein